MGDVLDSFYDRCISSQQRRQQTLRGVRASKCVSASRNWGSDARQTDGREAINNRIITPTRVFRPLGLMQDSQGTYWSGKSRFGSFPQLHGGRQFSVLRRQMHLEHGVKQLIPPLSCFCPRPRMDSSPIPSDVNLVLFIKMIRASPTSNPPHTNLMRQTSSKTLLPQP